LNEAYGVLSNPERRSLYDLKIGYSRWNVIQDPHQPLAQSNAEFFQGSKSAYLDASDRPLSAGEIFALLTMGITFLGCLILVIVVAFLRGDSLLPSTAFPQEHRVQFGLSTTMPSLRVLAPDLAPNLASNLFPDLSLHPKPIHAPALR
jgi:curved DNA-binding protein CbpA